MTTESASGHAPKPLIKRLAEGLMVLALAGMVIAVFVNVVLRYVFHTSIVSYEEISRQLFVWLVAIGAIVAAFEGAHLGFDMVTARVSPPVRKAMFWVSQVLIAMCMGFLLWGSWEQVVAGMQSFSTVLGYPLALGAAATLVLAVGMLIVVLRNMVRGAPAQPAADSLVE